jgi:hypothetical protein
LHWQVVAYELGAVCGSPIGRKSACDPPRQIGQALPLIRAEITAILPPQGELRGRPGMFGKRPLGRRRVGGRMERFGFRVVLRHGAPSRQACSSSDGFAAVDAMIALTIISTVVVLSLAALQTAHRASLTVAESRRARVELQYLLDNAPRALGVQNGTAGGFNWQVSTAAAGEASHSGARICDRAVQLTNLSSGRRYGLATAEICPPPPPASS